MKNARILRATVVPLTLLVVGCGEADDARLPVAPTDKVPLAAMSDMPVPPRTYDNACGTCHANGGFGVAVLADRLGADASLIHEGTRLPPETIRAIVRNGMGDMPAMSRVEVSDEELNEIIAYLVAASGAKQ